jgi:hypothetical protein
MLGYASDDPACAAVVTFVSQRPVR